jgi:urease accessory protein
LEYAVEAGQVRNAEDLTEWLATVLQHGASLVDAALLAAAWRATEARDDGAVDQLVELGCAWRGTAETALESSAQGAAFVTITTATWPDAALARIASRHGNHLPLAIAVAAAAAAQGISLEPALIAYLQAFAANLISAGVRLVPLGQTAGQRVLARLEPIVLQAARDAFTADLDELGTAAPLLDWCSMKHETQYTRLFRS